MSRIHVDDIYDKEGTGAPTLPAGVSVTGVTTSTSVEASTSVSVGGTSVMTAIDGKTSPGKAIALSLVFG